MIKICYLSSYTNANVFPLQNAPSDYIIICHMCTHTNSLHYVHAPAISLVKFSVVSACKISYESLMHVNAI